MYKNPLVARYNSLSEFNIEICDLCGRWSFTLNSKPVFTAGFGRSGLLANGAYFGLLLLVRTLLHDLSMQ